MTRRERARRLAEQWEALGRSYTGGRAWDDFSQARTATARIIHAQGVVYGECAELIRAEVVGRHWWSR